DSGTDARTAPRRGMQRPNARDGTEAGVTPRSTIGHGSTSSAGCCNASPPAFISGHLRNPAPRVIVAGACVVHGTLPDGRGQPEMSFDTELEDAVRSFLGLHSFTVGAMPAGTLPHTVRPADTLS